MPTRVVLVYDEPEFAGQLTADLRFAGYDVTAFVDPMAALEALDSSLYLEVLITRVNFGAGKVNGISLARMARSKRPGIRVLFAARPEFAEYAEGLGKFMPLPVSVPDIVDAVGRMLESDHHTSY
jgi:DNA-binding NtrC family response regulator